MSPDADYHNCGVSHGGTNPIDIDQAKEICGKDEQCLVDGVVGGTDATTAIVGDTKDYKEAIQAKERGLLQEYWTSVKPNEVAEPDSPSGKTHLWKSSSP